MLNSYKKSVNTNETLSRNTVNRQTDRRMDRADFIGLSCFARV